MDSATRRKAPRRSLSTGENFTPRTLIQGYLQTAQTVRQSPRKRARITPSSKSSTTPQPSSSASATSSASSASASRSRTPRTLPRSSSTGRCRSTRLEMLVTPGGSNPTPRGLITGFLQAADIQTPAVYVAPRRSSPRKQQTPAVSDVQRRADSGQSSTIESPADETFSRFARPQPQRGGRTRRRGAIDAEEFAARIEERLSQEVREEEGDGGAQETVGAGDASNRTILESIVEEPLDISMPRPDSTTKNSSFLQESSRGRSSSAREPRVRRSLLQDESLQIPSTSNVSISESVGRERKRSHPSASSVEDESLLAQASQETVQIQRSFNEDDVMRGEEARADEAEDRQEERREEEGEGVEEGDDDKEEREEDAEEVGEEGEQTDMEEDMDVDEDSFADLDAEHTVAPTQSAVASVKKSSRPRASPLRTPHLAARERRATPAAKTPAPFKQAANRQNSQRPQLRGAQKRCPSQAKRGKNELAPTLPKSLTRSIFSHFSKARVPRTTYDALDEASRKFFRNISQDLTAYSKHGGRSTIEQADVELLMRRQRLVSDKEPLEVMIEKYLPMEYRKELIPMAMSGNKVYPKVPKK